MHALFSDPNTLKLIDKQCAHVEALAHTAPSLDTPLLDHMRALLAASPESETPEVESISDYFRKRFNVGA